MDAKEELKKLSVLRSQVDRLLERRRTIADDMTSLKSSAGSLTTEKVQSSHSPDRILDALQKIEEIEIKLNERMLALVNEEDRIFWKIFSMQKEQYKDVLIYHYMRFMSFEEIAGKMNVSLRYVYRLHGEALKEYARL